MPTVITQHLLTLSTFPPRLLYVLLNVRPLSHMVICGEQRTCPPGRVVYFQWLLPAGYQNLFATSYGWKDEPR